MYNSLFISPRLKRGLHIYHSQPAALVLGWRFKDALMVAVNVSEHLWVFLGWNIPNVISAGLASSPRGQPFSLGTALVQCPGARPVDGEEHKAASVTDMLLSFTILFAW